MTSRWPYVCTKQWLGSHVCVQKNPVGIEFFSHVKTFFYSKQFAKQLTTWLKTSYWLPLGLRERGSDWDSQINNIFLLCYSTQPRSQERILIIRNWFMLTSNCRCMDAVESPNPSWLNCRSGCLVNVNWHGKTIVFGKEFLESAY